MASMQMAAGVNASAEDGGLSQVFTLTDVNALFIEKLKTEGVKTLMEFTNMWTKAWYEAEALAYRDGRGLEGQPGRALPPPGRHRPCPRGP